MIMLETTKGDVLKVLTDEADYVGSAKAICHHVRKDVVAVRDGKRIAWIAYAPRHGGIFEIEL